MAAETFIFTQPDSGSSTDFVMYRPDINEWWDFGALATNSFTGERRQHNAWHYNGVLYVTNGVDDSFSPSATGTDLWSLPLPLGWRDPDYAPAWTNRGDANLAPTNGWGAGGTAVFGGNVYMWGGVDRAGVLNESDITARLSLAALPTVTTVAGFGGIIGERSQLHSDGGVVGGKLYRGGGASSGSISEDEFEVFDPNTSTWTSLTDLPAPIHAHVMVSDGTYIYTIGGAHSGGNQHKSFRRYTIGTDTWESLTAFPGTIATYRTGFFLNGLIYVIEDETAVHTYAVNQDAGSGAWATLATPTNPDSVSVGLWITRAYGDEAAPVDLVTIPTQGPFAPVRSSARMDALSAARNFTAPPADLNVEQAFLLEPLEVIAPDIVVGFDEALTPGTVEFYYTPLGRQSREYLQEFTGETSLARMARTFPPAIMTLVSDVSDAIISDNLTADNTVAARYVIEYVFKQWAAQYPWFAYAVVPDLRIPLVAGEYGGGAGTLFTSTITIPQADDSERSMLDIMQELLAPFGAFKTMDGSNDVVIRPRYGPDADTSPVVTLKDNDLYSLSTGDPSRVGTKNRIVITKRPYDRTTDTPSMQDAYYQIRNAFFYDPTAMITDRVSDPPDAMPDSRLDLTDGTGSSTTLGYGAGYDPLFWPVGTGLIPEGSILFTDSTPTVQLDADFRRYPPFNGGTGAAVDFAYPANLSMSITDLPLDGAEYDIITVTRTETIGSFYVTLAGTWVNEPGRRGIQLRVSDSKLADYLSFVSPLNYWVGTFAIKLSDSSTTWTDRGASTTVTFGNVAGGDTLLATDGGNAIEDSQDARGILEETIDIGPYNPSLAEMNQMAEGLLLDKMTPRAIRIAEQSVVRAHPVRFEHVGRLVQLPDAEQGVVTSREYREQAGAVGADGTLSCEIEVMTPIVTASGYVDTDANYLITTKGSTITTSAGTPFETTDN